MRGRGLWEMACSCVYYSGVFVTGAFQRRALSTLFPKGLVSPSPFYQYHSNRRRVDASVSTAAKEQQQLRSPDLVALEYADLNLTHNVSQELGHVIIRQHVNPLSSSLAVWDSEGACGSTLPLMVDIGSGFKDMSNIMSGQVFIQSDVLDMALDMINQFDSLPHVLKHVDEIDSSVVCDSEGWLLSNPMGIRTEREIHAEFEGGKNLQEDVLEATVNN